MHNPIALYIDIVQEYLDMEKLIATCKTEQQWRKMAEVSNLHLELGFMYEYTELQLYEMIMLEHRNSLANVTDDLRDKIKTWKISIDENN